MKNVIYKGVSIGDGTVIEPPSIIGKPPRGSTDGDLELIIGENCHIRPFSTIYSGTKIGDNLQTGHGIFIREDNVLGHNVSIGTNAVLEHGNKIGDYSRVHSGCFMELTTIGKYVFAGPNVTFLDDPHPMCPKYNECIGGPVVEDFAKIGGHSTILPGVTIGSYSLVGAGSVVTCNVPSKCVVYGNPARVAKNTDDLVCCTGMYDKPYDWHPYNVKGKKNA